MQPLRLTTWNSHLSWDSSLIVTFFSTQLWKQMMVWALEHPPIWSDSSSPLAPPLHHSTSAFSVPPSFSFHSEQFAWTHSHNQWHLLLRKSWMTSRSRRITHNPKTFTSFRIWLSFQKWLQTQHNTVLSVQNDYVCVRRVSLPCSSMKQHPADEMNVWLLKMKFIEIHVMLQISWWQITTRV